MIIWMEVTRDRYELPVAVADSAAELARMAGVKTEGIWQHESKAARGKIKRQRFVKVEVEDD